MASASPLKAHKELRISHEELLAHADCLGTPFHMYHEGSMREVAREMRKAFEWLPEKDYRNYFAVKATPNPTILKILADEGMGADCSSFAELLLAEGVGLKGHDIILTSNNTALADYSKAVELGAIINFDDITHLEFFRDNISMPEIVCFRFNPGRKRGYGNHIIGKPQDAKFGVTRGQLFEGIEWCRKEGVERFGIHTMVVSNCLEIEELKETARMIFDLAVEIKQKLDVSVEFINLGGGIGVAYRPEQKVPDFMEIGEGVREHYEGILQPFGLSPRIITECGRCVTGPAGVLVARVIHRKRIYKNYVGIDASMANLMRPGLYGAYHHCTIIDNPTPMKALPKRGELAVNEECDGEPGVYDIVGGLCENNDKFAVDRELPVDPQPGDLAVIHDCGAHGHAMGFNYNGKLRSAEYLYREKNKVFEIRRKEELADLFRTLPNGVQPLSL